MLFEVIWSLGTTSNLTILFQSWRIIRSNHNKYLTIVSTYNILRPTFKVCCLMCTSWLSVNKCIRRRNTPLLESGGFAKYSCYWKQDKNISPLAISSHSYPNCWTCFVVELEALYRVGFDVILWSCRLGEFVLMLSYFACWI